MLVAARETVHLSRGSLWKNSRAFPSSFCEVGEGYPHFLKSSKEGSQRSWGTYMRGYWLLAPCWTPAEPSLAARQSTEEGSRQHLAVSLQFRDTCETKAWVCSCPRNLEDASGAGASLIPPWFQQRPRLSTKRPHGRFSHVKWFSATLISDPPSSGKARSGEQRRQRERKALPVGGLQAPEQPGREELCTEREAGLFVDF